MSTGESSKKHLYLIDGYGFVFRAYHSLPPLTNPAGTPVGAVYGFTNMLMKLKSDKVKQDNDDYMLVVFDSGSKSFRNDIYPEYKANRPPAPDDLIPQFDLVRDAAVALGLPVAEMQGFEADDIIATYTRIAQKQGVEVTIVSSDKDLMQLVGDGTQMYDAMRNRQIAEAQVEEKFGVTPDKLLDVLSLMGDSSDNVPGVPGIGPKTASQLINEYGSLDSLLERAEEIPQKKRRESLIEFADQARLSRDLIRLREDVAVTADIEKLAVREEDPQQLMEFLSEHGFKSLAARVGKKSGLPVADNQPPPTDIKAEYIIIKNIAELVVWLTGAQKSGVLAMYNADNAIALACAEGQSCYVEYGGGSGDNQASMDFGDNTASENSLDKQKVVEILQPFMENPAILKITHDIKPSLRRNPATYPIDDTMVMSYVLDGTRHKHDIANLAQMHIGVSPAENTDPAQDFCQKADIILRLHQYFRRRLFDDKILTIYETIERPLVTILADMERIGVKVDAQELNNLSQAFAKNIAVLEQKIHKQAGREFNIGSPKQLGEVLFDELGMQIEGKTAKKTKTGAYSTDSGVLERLAAAGYDIAVDVIKYRELAKLKNTYTDALVKDISPDTGRIHTSFMMTVVATGRLSSQHPNLQNIPIRSEEGRKIRKAFVAEKGHRLISADYSQIEIRLLAHMADIEVLKQAFRDGKDIHAITASQVFGVPLEEVSGKMRYNAKAINFGIIYGQSAFGLAGQLGISRGEAKDYIDAYFKQYPGIGQYMEEMKEIARKQGYVTTLYGRKCFVGDINGRNPILRGNAERAAINYPLQGSAADIIKKAMINVVRALEKQNMQSQLILQIHDELIIEAPEAEVGQAAKLVTREMENVTSLSIPIIAEAKTGHSWDEAH